MAIKKPLADLMRPQTLGEMVGQKHLLAPNKPLYEIITKHISISLILWGPPGTGKTTLAQVMSNTLKVPFEKFNASFENKAQLRKLIEKHPNENFVLLLDEIHRLTKPVQDYLLPYLENGNVLLVGTTTENPVMSIVPAIRSRCQIFEFTHLSSSDIEPVLQKAAEKFLSFSLTAKHAHAIANCSNGDTRVALNILETLNAMHPDGLTDKIIQDFAKQQHFSMDKDATEHYDYLSAYSDSLEGSDTDAALYYLAVILEAGDLETVVRRIKDAVAIDIGLASIQTVNTIINLANTALEIGLPRASTHLALATMLFCLSPKSDAVLQAYERAKKDAANPASHPMPDYLRDTHYKGADTMRNAGQMYNMFDEPFQVAKQAYLPNDLIGHHYFVPRETENDQRYYKRYQKLFEYIYDQPFKEGNTATVFDHNFKKKH